MTPLQIAEDYGHNNIVDYLSELISFDDSFSNQKSFNDFSKFSNNFLIKNKKAEVSDDDDFLRLEEEVNQSSGNENNASPSGKNLSSDLQSFNILNERKLLNSPNQSKSFSSDSDIEIYTEPIYLREYIEGILTKTIFTNIQNAQKTGKTVFMIIEVPDGLQRPFQISKDFSDLIVDVINELIEKDNLVDCTYEQYIKKLYDMLNDQIEDVPYKEQSPKEVLAFYKSVSETNANENLLDTIFSISDRILTYQIADILSISQQNQIIGKKEKQVQPPAFNKKVLIPTSSTSPIPPDLLPGNEIIEIDEYDSDNDIIHLPNDEMNHSFSQIQEESYKSHIKSYFPEELFDKIKADRESGDRDIELVVQPENDEIIEFLNQQLKENDLCHYSYEEYLTHILQEFFDNQEDYEIDDIAEELDD